MQTEGYASLVSDSSDFSVGILEDDFIKMSYTYFKEACKDESCKKSCEEWGIWDEKEKACIVNLGYLEMDIPSEIKVKALADIKGEIKGLVRESCIVNGGVWDEKTKTCLIRIKVKVNVK